TNPDNPLHALTFAYSQPAHGTVSGTAPNVTYTPAAGYTGADSFQFTASNGTAASAPAMVSLAIVAPPGRGAGLVGFSPATGTWLVERPSSASVFVPTPAAVWAPTVTWADMRVGDFNGDGLTDVAGRYVEAGQWWVGLADGTGH